MTAISTEQRDSALSSKMTGGGLLGLASAIFLGSLATSSATIALPTFAAEFEVPIASVQWIVSAYLLSVTALIVAAGRLGDAVGRRTLLVAGLSVFLLTSALCAAPLGLPYLIAMRALQGLSGAILMSMPMALVSDHVAKGDAGRAIGLLGSASAVGTAGGPALAGTLIAGYGWPAIFLVNLPLAVIALVLVYRCVPNASDAARKEPVRLDVPGIALFAVATIAYARAMSGDAAGYGGKQLAFALLFCLSALIFVRVERAAHHPLIDFTELSRDRLWARLATSFLVAAVMMTTLIVGPFFVSSVIGLGVLGTGLVVSLGPITVAVCGVPAGLLTDKLDAARATNIGLLVMLVGCLLFCVVTSQSGIGGYAAALITVTSGYALFQTANSAAVMAGVTPDRRGTMSGILGLSRNLGLITGTTLMSSVFAIAVGQRVQGGAGSQDAVTTGLHYSFALASAMIVVALMWVSAVYSLPSRHSRRWQRPR